jgi:hypothetical protein
MCIPGINVFDLDQNILNSMFPLSTTAYDDVHTLCSKLGYSYCNLTHIRFNRFKIYTLDKWLIDLLDLILVYDRRGDSRFFELNKNLVWPTCHFESQKLTDCMCILMYLVDSHLKNKRFIANVKKIYEKYESTFDTSKQRYIFYQILRQLSNDETIVKISDEVIIEKFFNQLQIYDKYNSFNEFTDSYLYTHVFANCKRLFS